MLPAASDCGELVQLASQFFANVLDDRMSLQLLPTTRSSASWEIGALMGREHRRTIIPSWGSTRDDQAGSGSYRRWVVLPIYTPTYANALRDANGALHPPPSAFKSTKLIGKENEPDKVDGTIDANGVNRPAETTLLPPTPFIPTRLCQAASTSRHKRHG